MNGRPLEKRFEQGWKRRFVAVLALALLASAFLSPAAAQDTGHSVPTIVFMTDFGVVDDSVALCKGVMYSIAPGARIVDLTHEVTPYSILDGARFLFGATPYFPAGTIFAVVIDPGVGSARKAVIVKSKRGQFFVLPDNGLMTLVQDRDGLEGARQISNREWMIGAGISSTFHGRDIFSPAAAHLARGDDWTSAGPEVPLANLVRLKLTASRLDDSGMHGTVIATDGPFGNLITNISSEDFEKLGYQHREKAPVVIGGRSFEIPFASTFSDVPLKRPLLYINSRGQVALAVNQGNFAAVYGVKPPVEILIRKKK